MNKQKDNGIEWTRPYGYDGYTLNPVRGCMHGCAWEMADGEIAVCYAKTIAERFTRAYPEGFEHVSFHPKTLAMPHKLKTPAGIFVGSMTDNFAKEVRDDWICEMLEMCRQAHWHIFMMLTKYPPTVAGL